MSTIIPIVHEIVKCIKCYHRFIITSHEAGDGDSIGSQLAMAFILQRMQKDVLILNKDPVPSTYDFLPGVERIQNEIVRNLAEFETVIILDCGSLERTGLIFPDSLLILNIDHHLKNEQFGQLNWVDSKMSSTAEMIYLLCQALSIPLDSAIGESLYTGILTDTGSFRFSNTTPACLRAAAALVESGVQPSYIANQVYERKNLGQLLLLGTALLNLILTENQKIAFILLRENDFKRYGATLTEAEGLVNYPLSLASVEVAILFKELSDEYFKVSFRSKGRINVAAIAETFQGGGHYNAAGAKIKGKFEVIRQQISELVNEQLTNW